MVLFRPCIPTYYLEIKEENLNELRNDLWNDLPVPADLIIKDKIYDVDIAYRGSYTRKFRKRSYFVEFIDPDMFDDCREFHLNAEYRDPSLIRNKLSLDFFQDLGVLSPESKHINLVRNGQLKGVYLQLESVDDLFLKKRKLPSGPIYYAVNNDANFNLTRDGKKKKSLLSGYERKYGKDSDDDHLIKLLQVINTTPNSELPTKLPHYIDIDKYLLWNAGVVCTMNNDGFTHNYALYRNSKTGLFEIMPWDFDGTWGRKISGGIMACDYVGVKGKMSNQLSYLLLQNSEFRKRYRTILEEIIESKFTINYLEKYISKLHQSLRPYVYIDPYKKRKIDDFDYEPEFIFKFIRDRTHFIKKHLVNLN